MTQFATEAVIDVRINERSLKSSRQTLEDGLGTVEVSPSVSGGAMPSNSGRSTSGAMMSGSPSAGSGRQSWGEHIDLNEYRNELLEDLNDKMEDGNFDRASRLGSMGGGLALGGIALGVGALSNVLSNFSWPSLPQLEQPGWLPPDLPQPGWLPLGLPEPDSMPIEEPTSEYPVESPGSKYPVGEPGSEYPVEEPGTEYPLEEPNAEYPLEEPQEKYPVEEPDPIQVDFGLPDVSGGDLLGGLLAGGAAVGSGLLTREYLKGSSGGVTGRGIGAGSSGFGIPAPSFLIGDRAAEAQRKDPNERGFIDRKLAGLVDGLGGVGGSQMMLGGGGGSLSKLAGPVARATIDEAQPDYVRENRQKQKASAEMSRAPSVQALVDAITKAFERKSRTGRDGSQSNDTTRTRNEFSTDISVEAQGVTERELERAMEQAKKEAVREVERSITGRRR